MVSVGSPDLIRCSGAGACTIRSQARQASLGRCVTITRYWAGITSSRSEVSSTASLTEVSSLTELPLLQQADAGDR
jgi:hypothetical protein